MEKEFLLKRFNDYNNYVGGSKLDFIYTIGLNARHDARNDKEWGVNDYKEYAEILERKFKRPKSFIRQCFILLKFQKAWSLTRPVHPPSKYQPKINADKMRENALRWLWKNLKEEVLK
jgi:hypothetical protein